MDFIGTIWSQRGQASVELIGAVLALVLVVAALWQGLRVAQVRWLAGAAAADDPAVGPLRCEIEGAGDGLKGLFVTP